METQLNNGIMDSEAVNGNSAASIVPRYTTPDYFTTSKGVKIKFIGLNPARLEQLQSAGKMPEAPYRMVETDLGEPQKELLTADSLLTAEEKAQWQEYQAKRKAVEDKRNENVLKYIFHDGIALVEKLEDTTLEEWKHDQVEAYGLEIPNNRIDLKFNYINAEVVGNSDDLAEIMAGVMERTGVSGEALDSVRATFRSDLRRSTTGEAQ